MKKLLVVGLVLFLLWLAMAVYSLLARGESFGSGDNKAEVCEYVVEVKGHALHWMIYNDPKKLHLFLSTFETPVVLKNEVAHQMAEKMLGHVMDQWNPIVWQRQALHQTREQKQAVFDDYYANYANDYASCMKG